MLVRAVNPCQCKALATFQGLLQEFNHFVISWAHACKGMPLDSLPAITMVQVMNRYGSHDQRWIYCTAKIVRVTMTPVASAA